MAFSKTAKLKGGSQYQLSPNCKKYTLRDYGFMDTKAGNFQYEITVKPDHSNSREVNFKVTVDKNVSGLKLSATNKTGLQEIDIYSHEEMQPIAAKIDYILQDLIACNILAETAKED